MKMISGSKRQGLRPLLLSVTSLASIAIAAPAMAQGDTSTPPANTTTAPDNSGTTDTNAIVVTVFYVLAIAGGLSGATYDPVTGASTPGPLFGVAYGLLGLWFLAVLVPNLAITWRRLHDTNRSGAFFSLGFIPLVGGIIVLVFTLLDSDPAGARFDA